MITPERLEKWTDEEVLTNLNAILQHRASITTDYVTERLDDDIDSPEIIVAEVLCIVSGNKAVFSEPRKLDWPLQMMPVPEAFASLAN